MSKGPSRYRIVDTPCRPCRFKLVPVALAGECWYDNNSWTEYFRTRQAAEQEVRRRGATVVP